jgi:hypothetical protein
LDLLNNACSHIDFCDRQKIWEELQQDLAAKVYIVPVNIGSSESGGISASLENMLAEIDLEDPNLAHLVFEGSGTPNPKEMGSGGYLGLEMA